MHRVLRGFINISALWAAAAGAFGLIVYYLWVWWVTGMPPHDVPLLWVGRYVLMTAAIGAMMGALSAITIRSALQPSHTTGRAIRVGLLAAASTSAIGVGVSLALTGGVALSTVLGLAACVGIGTGAMLRVVDRHRLPAPR